MSEQSLRAQQIVAMLRRYADPDRATVCARFFKTGKGQYGYGDRFLGVRVPDCRSIARQFTGLPFSEVEKLLNNQFHEARLCALLMLVHMYETGSDCVQAGVVDFYLSHTLHINNWDLVDVSVYKILGSWTLKHDNPAILLNLARSASMWERRMAIVGTYAWIQHGKFDAILAIANMMLHDSHDLIHKATGWMLREVGKKDPRVLTHFLNRHAASMPRTTLRYAIERFSPGARERFLSAKKRD